MSGEYCKLKKEVLKSGNNCPHLCNNYGCELYKSQLTKEDILSLEWKPMFSGGVNYYRLGIYNLFYYNGTIISIDANIENVNHRDSIQMFRGSCGTKEDLERLMKQIHVVKQ